MKRVLKWAVRGIWRLALVALVLLVLYVAFLPGWVEGRAVAALKEAGFHDATLQVRHLGVEGATLSAVRLGDAGRFGIGHLSLDYEISRLIHGEVGTIEIADLTWQVGIRNGALDWAPFSELEAGEGSGELPFRRLLLRSATLLLDWEGRLLRCALSGSIHNRGGDQLLVTFDAEVAGIALRLTGTVNPRALDADLTLTGAIDDLAALAASWPPTFAPLPGHVGGRLHLDGRIVKKGDGISVEMQAGGEEISWYGPLLGRQVALEGGSLEVTSVRGEWVDGAARLHEAAIRVRASAIHLAGLPPLVLDAEAGHRDGEGSDLRLELRDARGGVSDLALSARATGDVSALAAGSVAATIETDITLDRILALAPALTAQGIAASPEARLAATLDLRRQAGGAEAAPRLLSGHGRVGIAAEDLRLAGAGARLGGLSAESAYRFEMLGDTASLVLESGSRIMAQSFRARSPDAAWRARSVGPGALSLELIEDLRLEITDLRRPDDYAVQARGLAIGVTGVALRTGTTRIEGASMALRGGAEAAPGSVSGRLQAGSALRVQGGITATPQLQLNAGDDARPVFELSLDEAAALSFDGNASVPWRVAAPALRMRSCATAAWAEPLTTIERLALDWRIALDASPAATVATSISDGTLSWEGIRSAAGLRTASVSAGHLVLAAGADSPILTVRSAEGAPSMRCQLSARCPGELVVTIPEAASAQLTELALQGGLSGTGTAWEVQGDLEVAVAPSIEDAGASLPKIEWDGVIDVGAKLHGRIESGAAAAEPWNLSVRAATRKQQQSVMTRWKGGEASIGSIQIDARAQMLGDRPSTVTGQLRLGGAGLYHTPAALYLSDASAEIPFTFGAELVEKGRIGVDTIWLGDDLLPGITGSLSADQGRLELALEWPLLPGATAHGAAWLRPFDRIPRGEFTLDLPRFELGPGAQPGDLLQALGGVTLGGHVALAARIGIDGPRITPTMSLTLDQVSLKSEAWKAEATGIDAAITLDGLVPPTTPGGQRIAIARGKLGKLEVRDGELVFRIEGSDSLFIEQTSWGWAGGNLYAHAMRFDPGNPALDLVVYADHLQLGELLRTLGEGQATGEGTLYGRLRVRLQAGKDPEYPESFLYAEPGLGHLEIIDPTGFLERLPVEARGALRDFEYSVIKLRSLGEKGEKATLRVRGRSRDPAFPRELILDVNINGFDELLNKAIMVGRMSKGISTR